MKLLTKTNRIYLAFSLGVYLITGLAFYYIVKLVIYDEVESRLRVEERDFEAYIRAHDSWSSSCYFVENKIDVVPVVRRPPVGEEFKDTLILNRYDKNLSPFRQLTFYASIGGKDYRVAIRKSLIQSYRLIEIITLAMATFLALLLLGTFWFQGKLSGRLWQPFYETLANVKRFDLNSGAALRLEPQEITEFNELNDELRKMSEKIQQDYRSLKEFTENASHEIQTPLALINARVEQLIQSENLTGNQSYWIEEIYRASRRMSRLNQGLLLLAKIENRQFAETQLLNLTELLLEKLRDTDEVLKHKQLRVVNQGTGPFLASLPPALADSLLTNLVSNAIKHNQTGGRIDVDSSAAGLQISNTGSDLQSEPGRLFERFKKDSASPESVGLGLAIVKMICDNYGLDVTYTVTDGRHRIGIRKAENEV